MLSSVKVWNEETVLKSWIILQAKSEPRAAAPSAGPVLHSQPPQPTSSHASTLANTVRIEKLSDEEDEEVDITDDLSDAGNDDDKPQAVFKTESCKQEQLTGTDIQTDDPTEAGVTETNYQPCHTSPSPQTSTSLARSEETVLTGLDERCSEGVSQPPKDLHTGAHTASELMTDGNEGPNFLSESSEQTGQVEKTCSEGAGKTAVFLECHLLIMASFFSCEVSLWSYLPPRSC